MKLVENLLLIGVGVNVKYKGTAAAIAHHALGPECTEQPLPLIFLIKLKLVGVPIAVKGSGNLLDGAGQVLGSHLHIPLQAARNGCVGQVGGAHIGGGKAGIPVEHIGFRMEPGALGIIADLDFGIGQLAQLLDGLDIRGTHVGGGDDSELSAILGKLSQLVHNKPKTAPFDEGHQHIDLIRRTDLLLQF